MTASGDSADFIGLRASADQQHWHTVSRSKLFVVAPIVTLCALAANFIWEAIRHNVDEKVASQWPLRLSVIDLQTTTAIGATLAGLMLTRAQFARTVQPHFGYSWTTSADAGIDKWHLYFYNAGPGYAGVKLIEYRVGGERWRQYQELPDFLAESGIEDIDVEFQWLGRLPLPPQGKATDGKRIGSFTLSGLARIDPFEVRILAEDSLGDQHQLIIHSSARLPLRAWQKLAQLRTGS